MQQSASRRFRLVWVLLPVLAAIAGIAFWWRTRAVPEAPSAADLSPPAAVAEPEPPPPTPAAEPPAAAPGSGVLAPPPAAPQDELVPGSGIDLESVRAALPDNLYWELAAPTQDPRVLAERERERARWEEAFGRVQAGDASKEEIEAYFDHRQRLSSDYVRVVDYLLEHHEADLSEEHLALLHTARRLHLARLEEIPRRLQEAYDRGKAQEEARAAWREQQRELEAEETPDAPSVP